MSIAVIHYDTPQGGAESFRVRPGQSVLIGSSNSSDIVLSAAESHQFELTFRGGRLRLRSLSGPNQILQINGETVSDGEIFSNDRVLIGNQAIRVDLPETAARPMDEIAAPSASSAQPGSELPVITPPADAAAEVHDHPQLPPEPDEGAPYVPPARPEVPGFERLESGLGVCWISRLEDDLLPQLKANPELGCAALVRHWETDITPKPAGKNLLAELEELESDLYLLPGPLADSVVPIWRQYAEHDGGVLLIFPLATPVAESDAEGLAPWLVGCTEARFHLLEATEALIELLFEQALALVVPNHADEYDQVFLLDEAVTDLASLQNRIGG